jgi:hypothetical protein
MWGQPRLQCWLRFVRDYINHICCSALGFGQGTKDTDLLVDVDCDGLLGHPAVDVLQNSQTGLGDRKSVV